jgi:hypothetical protein
MSTNIPARRRFMAFFWGSLPNSLLLMSTTVDEFSTPMFPGANTDAPFLAPDLKLIFAPQRQDFALPRYFTYPLCFSILLHNFKNPSLKRFFPSLAHLAREKYIPNSSAFDDIKSHVCNRPSQQKCQESTNRGDIDAHANNLGTVAIQYMI